MASSGQDDPELQLVFAQLLAREPIFHRPLGALTRAEADGLMLPGYWEIGASGRRYDRERVLKEMGRREAEPVEDGAWLVTDADCRRLSADTYLFTYRLDQDGRLTRRATIWVSTAEGWRIAYHQGTIVSGDAT